MAEPTTGRPRRGRAKPMPAQGPVSFVQEQVRVAREELNPLAEEAFRAAQLAREELATARRELSELRAELDQLRREPAELLGCLREAREQARLAEEAAGRAGEALREARVEADRARAELEEARRAANDGPPRPKEPAVPLAPAPIGLVPARLVRYLDEARQVEQALEDQLQDLADEAHPEGRAVFAEHRRVTHRQQQRLEQRLRALGNGPSGASGAFRRGLGLVTGAIPRSEDEEAQSLRALFVGLGAEQFEVAMYEYLEAYARAVGDAETAQLAGELCQEEHQVAGELRAIVAGLVESLGQPGAAP